MRLLVRHRPLHRLGDDPKIGGGVVPERAEIELLQDVQHLEQHEPAAGRMVGREAPLPVCST
jgi:hypothetical protein